MAENSPQFVVTRVLADEAATAALGLELALFAQAGDWVGLSGELGAGKSVLARGLIRGLAAEGAAFDVPSPTFTLIQLYDDLRVPVAHCDLYRLGDVAEADELGLDDFALSHMSLVEWPVRLCGHLPADRLMIELEITGDGRLARMTGHGRMAVKLERMEVVAGFLAATNMKDARRSFFQGDASSRRYEKLEAAAGECCLLMDMPDVPDGPPGRHGKPYSALAHLATGISAVLAINNELRARGFSAPETLASDAANGLALIEYFDGEVYGDMARQGKDMSEPMTAAVCLLADMAGSAWPQRADVPGAEVYSLATYDETALLIEVELLLDWFWPVAKGEPAGAEVRGEFFAVWRQLIARLARQPQVWVLRDFHSPNLIWLADRDGAARVGLIDTQDAVLGSPAYDLVSMLQDARIDVPSGIERELLDYYCAYREAAAADAGTVFDDAAFRRDYAILGAQRATKILGIFVRLFKRDGKAQYLRHVSRVSRALERNLAHPELGELRKWYDRHLPAAERERLDTVD